MKTPRYYISLAFARYSALKLAGFAENIAVKTALITVFTTPEPPLADITTAATNLRLAEEATDQGGTQATEERDNAFDTLEGLLRELAAYIEDKAKNDQTLMLSTGFEVTTANHSAPVIMTPNILAITNIAEGKLQFSVQSCGARAYELWGRTGTADFAHFLNFTDPRNPVVDGLTSGALYDWKVRALYGNNTYSEWSDVVSHRVT
jgi:hypothetical protein